MSRQRKADLLLVLATAFWGVSYFLLDLCLTELPPLTLNAFRFLTAFFVLGAIFFRKLRGISRRTLLASIPIGLCLVLTYIGCTYGVLYTSLSNAGFICALPVVVTPLLEWLFLRKRPDRRLAVALVLCTVGAFATNNRIFDVQSILIFGLVGYIYHKFSLPTTPFVLCFLIGEMLETYLRRGIMQYKSFGAFFARPIFDVFFFIAIGVLVWTVTKELKAYKAKKQAA